MVCAAGQVWNLKFLHLFCDSTFTVPKLQLKFQCLYKCPAKQKPTEIFCSMLKAYPFIPFLVFVFPLKNRVSFFWHVAFKKRIPMCICAALTGSKSDPLWNTPIQLKFTRELPHPTHTHTHTHTHTPSGLIQYLRNNYRFTCFLSSKLSPT